MKVTYECIEAFNLLYLTKVSRRSIEDHTISGLCKNRSSQGRSHQRTTTYFTKPIGYIDITFY